MKLLKQNLFRLRSTVLFLIIFSFAPNRVLSQNYDTGLDLPAGFTEYDLGANTVAYFEEMMPKIEDEDIQMRIEEVLDRLMQGISLRDGVDEIVVDLVDQMKLAPGLFLGDLF